MGCRSRRGDGASSPALSDTSDSDISLGTHSPVPSSLHLQHSPGSVSNGANDESLSVDDDKPRDLTNSISTSSTSSLAAYPTPPTIASCLPPSFKLDPSASSLFSAGCYLQSFNNLKEMSQQFPIQPIVIRPHPQIPSQPLNLNGSHLHANYAAAYAAVQEGTPPKIRINSPEKLNSTANSIRASLTSTALQDTSSYHHNAQLLHRPFSTTPEISASSTEIS